MLLRDGLDLLVAVHRHEYINEHTYTHEYIYEHTYTHMYIYEHT